ncbi:MAG: hypothetical protein HY982_02065 [Candidatus Magasanikbacteria bacterium]|nr:hypothetical protein [Candidatus Magasanikbacteria bacterium]
MLSVLVFLFFAGAPVEAEEKLPEKPNCSLSVLQSALKDSNFKPSAIMPLCVHFEGTVLESVCGCRNVNVFIQLFVKFADWLLKIVGGAALIMFIYGGFVILTAAGGERVKKGKDILVAAVIGLVIVFTANLGMRFLLEKLLPASAPEKGKPAAPAEGLQINLPESPKK